MAEQQKRPDFAEEASEKLLKVSSGKSDEQALEMAGLIEENDKVSFGEILSKIDPSLWETLSKGEEVQEGEDKREVAAELESFKGRINEILGSDHPLTQSLLAKIDEDKSKIESEEATGLKGEKAAEIQIQKFFTLAKSPNDPTYKSLVKAKKQLDALLQTPDEEKKKNAFKLKLDAAVLSFTRLTSKYKAAQKQTFDKPVIELLDRSQWFIETEENVILKTHREIFDSNHEQRLLLGANLEDAVKKDGQEGKREYPKQFNAFNGSVDELLRELRLKSQVHGFRFPKSLLTSVEKTSGDEETHSIKGKLSAIRVMKNQLEEKKNEKGIDESEKNKIDALMQSIENLLNREDSPEKALERIKKLKASLEATEAELARYSAGGDVDKNTFLKKFKDIQNTRRALEEEQIKIFGKEGKAAIYESITHEEKGQRETDIQAIANRQRILDNQIKDLKDKQADITKAAKGLSGEELARKNAEYDALTSAIQGLEQSKKRVETAKNAYLKENPDVRGTETAQNDMKDALKNSYESKLSIEGKGIREWLKKYGATIALGGAAGAGIVTGVTPLLVGGTALLGSLGVISTGRGIARKMIGLSFLGTDDARFDNMAQKRIRMNKAVHQLIEDNRHGTAGVFSNFLQRRNVVEAAKAYKRNTEVMDVRYARYKERSDRMYEMSKRWAKNYRGLDLRWAVRNVVFWRSGIRLGNEKGKATMEMMRDWQRGNKLTTKLKISEMLDDDNVTKNSLETIVGKAACDLAYADPQVVSAPDERKDEVAAILLLKKVEVDQQKLYKAAMQRLGTPDYLKDPDISFEEIEKSKKEVAEYQEKEYKKLPGHANKAVQIMKKVGLNLSAKYNIEDYRHDMQIWAKINTEPYTYMILENQFTTLCNFFAQKKLSNAYQFEPEDILTLKDLKFKVSLLEFQELWEIYKEKEKDSTPTPREFMDWIKKQDKSDWKEGGSLHSYSMESAEKMNGRADKMANKASAGEDAISFAN